MLYTCFYTCIYICINRWRRVKIIRIVFLRGDMQKSKPIISRKALYKNVGPGCKIYIIQWLIRKIHFYGPYLRGFFHILSEHSPMTHFLWLVFGPCLVKRPIHTSDRWAWVFRWNCSMSMCQQLRTQPTTALMLQCCSLQCPLLSCSSEII